MQPFVISCPGCGSRFAVRNSEALGTTRGCPKCTAPIEIIDPNAPLQQRAMDHSWNRRALTAGSAAAVLVLVAAVVLSRGREVDHPVAAPSPQLAVAEEAPKPLKEKRAPAQSANESSPPEPQTAQEQKQSEHPLTPQKASDRPEQVLGTNPASEDSGIEPEAPSAEASSADAVQAARDAPAPTTGALESFFGPGSGKTSAGSKGDRENGQESTEEDSPVQRRLRRKVVIFEYEAMPLDAFAEEFSEVFDLDVELDYPALSRLRVAFDTPVTLKLKDTSPAGILSALTDQLDLAYTVEGRAILITAPPRKSEGPKFTDPLPRATEEDGAGEAH